MRRFLLLGALLAWAPNANAAPPAVSIQASSTLGQAPFEVTLSATGTAASYSWDFGDGSQAAGAVVQHRYATGRYTATVTAVAPNNEAAQATVVVTALTLSLAGPRRGTFGRRAVFRGSLVPAIPGATISLGAGESPVALARTDAAGRFRVRTRFGRPAAYVARFGNITSPELPVAVRPALDVFLPRSQMVGKRLALRAALRPAGSGTLRIRLWRSGRELPAHTFAGSSAKIRLPTRRAGEYVVRLVALGVDGFASRSLKLRSAVYLPWLQLGSRGPSVRILERRLAALRYALRGVNSFYSHDTADAVLAFQKVNRMARTSRVNPAFWRRLQVAHVPRPRYRGRHHLEIDKSRQVLFEVDHGRVVRVVHVSTGATGNTPVGRWHVYSKVPGFLPSGMFYSSFFLRGFAVHGYASVPAYPASHGCVRTPMWIAPTLFASNGYGETVYVY